MKSCEPVAKSGEPEATRAWKGRGSCRPRSGRGERRTQAGGTAWTAARAERQAAPRRTWQARYEHVADSGCGQAQGKRGSAISFHSMMNAHDDDA